MNYETSWRLVIDKQVEKQLKKIPRKDCARILNAISEFTINPFAGDVQKMKGEENVWRRRVGSFRIFYEVLKKEAVIFVYSVERRTSTTY